MATTYKVLGQLSPSATTATTLYTAPSSSVVSTITVCNRGTVAGTYRIAIRKSGASLSNEHYIVYDAPLNGKTTTAFTIGITLGNTDVITVYASSADFSFSAFGSEVN